VLFAVLDHFTRRNDDQKRVIGTLLGVVDEVRLNVSLHTRVAEFLP